MDPQRDIDRLLVLLEKHGVRLTDVFETHIHNDYLTGGLALARRRLATRVDTRRLTQAFTGLVLAVAVATASQALPALV